MFCTMLYEILDSKTKILKVQKSDMLMITKKPWNRQMGEPRFKIKEKWCSKLLYHTIQIIQNHNLSEEINQILLTIVPVHDVITCWIAQGVTKTIKVREMAAEHLDVVSHTLCSSKICCWDKLEFHYYVFIDDYFLK